MSIIRAIVRANKWYDGIREPYRIVGFLTLFMVPVILGLVHLFDASLVIALLLIYMRAGYLILHRKI